MGETTFAQSSAISPAGRVAASVMAAMGWMTLVLQFWLTVSRVMAHGGSMAGGILVYVSYFTILTNLLMAAVFTAVAFGRPVGASLLGAVTVFMLVVGIVYALLLRSLWTPQGWQKLTDTMLHDVAPALALAFWLLFAPRGRLGWRDPVIWLSYPLGYFLFALMRGAATGWYAYPFLNVPTLGYSGVSVNAVLLAATFLGLGLVLVAVDRSLATLRVGTSQRSP